MNNEVKEIRDFIKCPQFGDIKYGKWGSLRLDVRQTLLNLINVNDSMDYIIKQQYEELQRKDNIINELKNGIKELDNMFYETFRISQDGYFSISEWELKDFTDKIKELEGDKK